MIIKGLLVDVESSPGKFRVVEIEEENLSEFYSCLKCDTIDIVTRKIGDKIFDIVCDDEGLFKEEPFVSAFSSGGEPMLVGNLFVCNHYKENLTSLSKDDIDYIGKYVAIASYAKKEKDDRLHAHPVLTNVDYV